MEHWYALHTKPRREFQVERILASKGVETYLPVIPAPKRVSGASFARKESAFFPGYLFARLNLSNADASIRWLPGLRAIVSFGGEPAPVPEPVIGRLRRRVAELAADWAQTGCAFRKGETVRIASGPLRDLEAVFDRRISAAGRVRVLVHVLGRLTACDIDLSLLQKAR